MFLADAAQATVSAVGHIPTLPANGAVDALRVVVSIWAAALVLPLFVIAHRTRVYGFYALACFCVTAAVAELDQVGRPFIVYQLPLRAVAVGITTYWMWKRRNIHA